MSATEIAALGYKVPLWPWGQYFAIGFIAFTFGIMVWFPEYHLALAVGIGFLAVMTLMYFTCAKRHHRIIDGAVFVDNER